MDFKVTQPPTCPTLKAPTCFDPEEDAKALRKAMKGFGTDEDGLIDILAHRTCEQRMTIKQKYYSMYGQKLEDAITSETSGNFQRVLLALLKDRATLSAYALHKAMKGAGTNERTLIQILCPASNDEICDIRKAFKEVLIQEGYSDPARTLESDLESDLSGYFKRIMIALVQGNREDSDVYNRHRYKQDLEDLYNAGEGQLGTDEEVFIRIFASRSGIHLRNLNRFYQQQTGKTLLEAIDSEMSGNLCEALKLILYICENSAAAYADMLHRAIAGCGTEDITLMYIVVSQCEIDLQSIADVYHVAYGESLANAIRGDTSGDYRKTLLTLLGVT